MGEQKTTNIIVLVSGFLYFTFWVFSRAVKTQDAIKDLENTQLACRQILTSEIKALSVKVDLNTESHNLRLNGLERWLQRVIGVVGVVIIVVPLALMVVALVLK